MPAPPPARTQLAACKASCSPGSELRCSWHHHGQLARCAQLDLTLSLLAALLLALCLLSATCCTFIGCFRLLAAAAPGGCRLQNKTIIVILKWLPTSKRQQSCISKHPEQTHHRSATMSPLHALAYQPREASPSSEHPKETVLCMHGCRHINEPLTPPSSAPLIRIAYAASIAQPSTGRKTDHPFFRGDGKAHGCGARLPRARVPTAALCRLIY